MNVAVATPSNDPPHEARALRRLLALCFVAFVVGMSLFCMLRHHNLWSDIFDMGVQTQVVWNTANGRWFESSVETANYLGDHTSYITLLVAAVYALLPAAETLLVLQVLAFGLGAFTAYRIAAQVLDDRRIAALFGIAWLAQPAAGYALAYEYHPLAFAPLFALLTYDFALRRRPVAMWLSFALLLATREDCGLTAVALGALLAFEAKRRHLGFAMACLGVAAFAINLFVMIPMFRGEASDTIAARYGHLGESGSDIVATLLTRPDVVASLFVDDLRRLWFLPTLMAPMLLLAMLSPVGLLALAFVAAPSLLSSSPLQYSIGWHYPFIMLPIVLIASVHGLQRLLRWRPTLTARPVAFTATWFVVLAALNAQSVVITHRWMVPRNPVRSELAELRPLIPDNAALAATSKVGAQFAERRQLMIYPDTTWPRQRFEPLPHEHATHVLVDINQPRLTAEQTTPDPSRYALLKQTKHLRLYVHRDAQASRRLTAATE